MVRVDSRVRTTAAHALPHPHRGRAAVGRCTLTLVFLILMVASAAMAQTGGGATLVGSIKDSTGALIPSAKVTVLNTGTGVRSETTATAEGSYYVPYLNPGSYRITVEASGFKRFVRDGIDLRSGETPRVDITLEVGSLTDTVEVSASADLLNTETATAGQALGDEVLERMANVQKRIVRALYYFPGAVGGTEVGYHVLGQSQNAIGYTLDGITGKTPGSNTFDQLDQVIQTTQDALEEIKVLTTGISADTGHSAGGAMQLVYKSGTNGLHASYEDRYLPGTWVQRDYLQQNPTTTPWHYQAMDLVASGPLIIPKIYNGKNRTFWLFGWSAHLENWAYAGTGTVPTPEMLNGDFSFPGAPGGAYPMYDPFSTRLVNGLWIRDPIASNQISPSLFDPVVKKFLAQNNGQIWGKPDNPNPVLTRSGPNNNIFTQGAKIMHRTRWDVKVDQMISANHKLFARYSQAHHRTYRGTRNSALLWEALDSNINPMPTDNINGVLNDTYVFGPTRFNEFRIGYNRRAASQDSFLYGQDWATKLGIPGVSGPTFPYFNIGFGINALNRSYDVGEDIVLQDNYTQISGPHTLKMGYEMMRTRTNSAAGDFPAGQYTFGGTSLPNVTNTGQAFANFLLGTVTSASFSTRLANNLPRWWKHDLYFQDDWKARRDLTLTLGVRWSVESPIGTKYGQQSQWDPNAVDPLTGLMGAITHPNGLIGKYDLNNFQPRFGLVWNFARKWVFRGSFGVYTQDMGNSGGGFDEYSGSVALNMPSGDPNYKFLLKNGPGPLNYTILPDGTVPYNGTNLGSRGANWRDPNLRNPYSMNWSGGFQYEFARSWLLELMYQGAAGVGQIGTWSINEIPLSITLGTNTVLQNAIYVSKQPYVPYTQFGGINLTSNFGHNTYHGATVRAEKRYAKGLVVNGFYTYSKNLTDNGSLSYYYRAAKSRSSYDLRHNFTIMATYELPFGKGRSYMNQSRLLDYVLGGWNITWTQTMQSGKPISVTPSSSPYRYLTPTRVVPLTTVEQAIVPNWDIGPNRFPQSARNPVLKLSSFAYAPAFTAGFLAADVFEAPWIDWMQFAVSKSWLVKDRLRFTLRADGHNLPFKQPQYGSPDTGYNPNSTTFGTIGGVRGAWSEFGTGQPNMQICFRAEF
jgi:hypothetical protein